jgi:hypothetical protein
MKIRPKARRYNDDEMDESYFAARSNGEQNNREELVKAVDLDLKYHTEFKIFDKKLLPFSRSNRMPVSAWSSVECLPRLLFAIQSKPHIFYCSILLILAWCPNLYL